jgi:anti-sigma B factor antagonist
MHDWTEDMNTKSFANPTKPYWSEILPAGDVTILKAHGKIKLGEGSTIFKIEIGTLLAEGRRKFLIDMTNISYVDVSGIGVLVSGFTDVTNVNGKFKLLGLANRVKELLVMTNLYSVFEVFDDKETALQSFQK